MRIGLFILLFLFTFYCWGDVYKSTDQQGNITYSDTPLNDTAEKIELPQDNQTPLGNASTAVPKVMKSAPEDTAIVGVEKKPYTRFVIASPTNEATIQNQPVIVVEIDVDPALQEGDMIQIYLDGNPWGTPQHGTHFQFTQPDRGTHQISAKLIDDKKTILQEAGPYTVYIHQAHIPTSPPVPL